MTNILDLIMQNIDKATLIVLALAGLLTTVIVQYKKLRKLLAEKDLAEIIAPISSEADTKPANILNSLINKPLSLDSTAQHVSTGQINSNEGKALIVAAKAFEQAKAEKPSILKRLGINNVSDMIPIVSGVYQGIVKTYPKAELAMRMGFGLGLGSRGGGGGSPDMILVYAIPASGTPIQLAIQANSTWFSAGQEVVINWGYGSANETVSATSGHTGYIGHTYTTAGTYTIKISGSMTMYGRASAVNILGQTLLTRVDSFGKLGLTSFSRAFQSCTGLTSVPKTLPDSMTNISNMFGNCTGDAFNPDVSNWDVSKVTIMSYMFYNCSRAAFNPNMKSWTLKTSVTTTNMFTLSKTQTTAWLDELLIAWAANPLQGSNITIDFSPNKFTENGGAPLPAVADALTTLEGKGWTIATANPYSST